MFLAGTCVPAEGWLHSRWLPSQHHAQPCTTSAAIREGGRRLAPASPVKSPILPRNSLDNVLFKTQYLGANWNEIKICAFYHEKKKKSSVKTDVKPYLQGNHYLISCSSSTLKEKNDGREIWQKKKLTYIFSCSPHAFVEQYPVVEMRYKLIVRNLQNFREIL